MKKSVLFLINGLGIEKAGSYSIAIDQCMPQLCRTKETSFFTTAIINSLEYRSAYEAFYLGDTYRMELDYIRENILNESLVQNPTFQALHKQLQNDNSKLHVFLEPSTEKVVEEVNELVKLLQLYNKPVYLHLLLTQQTVNEYQKLVDIVNYIKYHLNSGVTVGFIIGKELYSDEMTKDEVDAFRKLVFFCSAERWTDTDKKLLSLKDENIRPCVAPGFCATNDCTIQNGDAIVFFNTRRTSYDKFIRLIKENAEWAFRTNEINLYMCSVVQLDTEFDIPCLSPSIYYDKALCNLLQKAGKKALIITGGEHIKLINFLANGLNYVNNPNIQFMKNDDPYLQTPGNIQTIIDNGGFDLIIFDYHMDVSKTVNDLKEQLTRIDGVLGQVAEACVNKHSLIITSLYGLKKELPIAPYNSEMVTLDYEMQIPIFFFDYSYPRSKYIFRPGETNDILFTALRCIWNTNEIDSLIFEKGILNNIFKAIKK